MRHGWSFAWALARECWRRRTTPIQMIGTDSLTGVKSRMAWDIWGRHILGAGVIAIDLDGFKKVNDTLGHEHGDFVLKQVGSILNVTARADRGRVFRVGGDEFIVLSTPSVSSLHQIGKDIVDHVLAANLGVSASVGIGNNVSTADRALYEAKRSGKNRVAIAEAFRQRFLASERLIGAEVVA